MKKVARVSAVVLAFIGLLALAPAARAEEPAKAETKETAKTTITKEQAGAISQSCDSIKQSLKTLQKTDSKTRAFLGSTYENLISNFISPLNLRLTKNNLPSATLSDLHSSIGEQRQQFVQDFTSYSRDLETLIAMDCKNNPEEFYTQLEKTRKSRAALEQTIDALRMLFTKHVNGVNSLKGNLK